jgi:hypothetical protein
MAEPVTGSAGDGLLGVRKWTPHGRDAPEIRSERSGTPVSAKCGFRLTWGSLKRTLNGPSRQAEWRAVVGSVAVPSNRNSLWFRNRQPGCRGAGDREAA